MAALAKPLVESGSDPLHAVDGAQQLQPVQKPLAELGSDPNSGDVA